MYSAPGLTTLTKKESLRFQVIKKFMRGKISRSEASLVLQVSERTISRLARKVENRGVWGVKNGNLGRKGIRKYPDELRELVLKLYVESYFDFNLRHFSEKLKEDHNIEIPYQTLWGWCKHLRLIKKPRKRRRIKRIYRDRMPQEGLLLQMDGSHHRWNGKDEWCLIAAIDDATSEIPYAEFFEGETTLGCLKVLKRIIELKGVPKAIYTDKAGWSAGPKRAEFSHFQNACDKLGIQIIYADSPEAKGRIERSFRTFQDRLVPELRSKRIKKMATANQYLQDVFLKNYWNVKNTVRPMQNESAYLPIDPYIDPDTVFCIEEPRKIMNDQTTSWQNKRYKVEIGRYNIAGFEALFRIDLSGRTRVFVMENEAQFTPVQEALRNEEIESEKLVRPINPRLYPLMWRTVTELRNEVVRSLVSGKPLKLPNQKKKVA